MGENLAKWDYVIFIRELITLSEFEKLLVGDKLTPKYVSAGNIIA